MAPRPAGPTWLYRAFIADELVYVGITCEPAARVRAHSSLDGVTRIIWQRFPTRAEAARAEAALIRSESPRRNRNGVCGRDAIYANPQCPYCGATREVVA